ncbi:hypothetical protein FACS1894182_12220 [Bacteroidia bacterium]|nr:hypothetical protein FACS1894182_12220 [Bacteroidia bacterium]
MKNWIGKAGMVMLFSFIGAIGIIAGPKEPPKAEDGSCTVTTKCFNKFGEETGSVSCTGTSCSRTDTWVQCNGNPKISC